jgi:hypothetical protein
MNIQKKYYHIIDDMNRYYCYNDFNGKAAMLPPDNENNPPSIAMVMEKTQAENKIKYLMERTKNNFNNLILKEVL